MKMLLIEKCLLLKDSKELRIQSKLRYELINQMVGKLYPNILLCEIMKINGRISDIRENRI